MTNDHLAAFPPETGRSLQKLQPNKSQGDLKPQEFQPHPGVAVFPDLPEELQALLSLENRDLTMQHWGLILGLWLLQDKFPLSTSNVRNSLNLSRERFWQTIDKLVERHIIWLRWGRKYKYFQAFFTSGKSHDVKLQRGEIHDVDTSRKSHDVTPHIVKKDALKPHIVNSALGGGGVYIKSTTTTPTPEETRLALAGDPWSCLSSWIPAFQAGLIVPHFQEAVALDPGNAVARLRGAVFTLDDRFRRGQAPKNPLAALMSYVQKNLVLEEKSTYGDKKAPASPGSPKVAPEVRPEDAELLNKMASLTFDEARAEVSSHPYFRTQKKSILQTYIALLKKNPCQDEFRAWAEKELAL